jgi:hypothetical protein
MRAVVRQERGVQVHLLRWSLRPGVGQKINDSTHLLGRPLRPKMRPGLQLRQDLLRGILQEALAAEVKVFWLGWGLIPRSFR